MFPPVNVYPQNEVPVYTGGTEVYPCPRTLRGLSTFVQVLKHVIVGRGERIAAATTSRLQVADVLVIVK